MFDIPYPSSRYMGQNRGEGFGSQNNGMQRNQNSFNQIPYSQGTSPNQPPYQGRQTPNQTGTQTMHQNPSQNETKPVSRRAMNDKIKWDGSLGTFESFMNKVEGHMNQTGLGYLNTTTFMKEYLLGGNSFLIPLSSREPIS